MKKHTLTVLFIFSMGASLCQNLDSLLLLHYPFTGNANDASGNGFHGTVYNATPADDHHGNPNQAYYFNGIDSHISLPLDSELKPQLPLSFSFLVKFDDLTLENTQILTTDFSQNSYTGVWFNLNPITNAIQVSYGCGIAGSTGPIARRTKTGSTSLEANTWYFVIVVIRGPLDMTLIINCNDDNGSYSGTGGDIEYSSFSGSLGRHDLLLSTPHYFKGYLDEFRYWARALTPEDITLLCDPAGIEESTTTVSEKLLVFPNPANDILHVETTMPLGFFKYRIVNILGKTIDSGIVQQDEASEIQIAALPAGVYVIIVNDGIKEHSTRFIKQ